jgi:hypothetical protein
MTMKNQKLWDECVEKNKDCPYGSAINKYAQRWAELAEERMAENSGIPFDNVLGTTSKEANLEGITGFMRGCAVSLLSATWIHGEALRRWHNLHTQVGNEGYEANKSGDVLNPAILRLR